mmetsp:Transcript_94349/g.288662  ORF Transcript_94349/g.288662 Transcript_94349/m.288662 type:complete len:620 (-) Transcript_94349:11-1870(-)
MKGRGTLRPEALHDPSLPLKGRVIPGPIGSLDSLHFFASPRRHLELDDLRPLAATLHDGVQRRPPDAHGLDLRVVLVRKGDVRLAEELADHLLAGLGLEVQHDALLPDVLLRLPGHHHHRRVIGQFRAHLVHCGAQLGHHAPTRWPSEHVAKVDDRVACEGLHGMQRLAAVPCAPPCFHRARRHLASQQLGQHGTGIRALELLGLQTRRIGLRGLKPNRTADLPLLLHLRHDLRLARLLILEPLLEREHRRARDLVVATEGLPFRRGLLLECRLEQFRQGTPRLPRKVERQGKVVETIFVVRGLVRRAVDDAQLLHFGPDPQQVDKPPGDAAVERGHREKQPAVAARVRRPQRHEPLLQPQLLQWVVHGLLSDDLKIFHVEPLPDIRDRCRDEVLRQRGALDGQRKRADGRDAASKPGGLDLAPELAPLAVHQCSGASHGAGHSAIHRAQPKRGIDDLAVQERLLGHVGVKANQAVEEIVIAVVREVAVHLVADQRRAHAEQDLLVASLTLGALSVNDDNVCALDHVRFGLAVALRQIELDLAPVQVRVRFRIELLYGPAVMVDHDHNLGPLVREEPCRQTARKLSTTLDDAYFGERDRHCLTRPLCWGRARGGSRQVA